MPFKTIEKYLVVHCQSWVKEKEGKTIRFGHNPVCAWKGTRLLCQSHLAGGMALLSWGDSGAACTMALQTPNPRLGSLICSWNELNIQFHMIPGTQEGKVQHLLLNWTFKSGHAAQPALALSCHIQARLSYETFWKTKRRAEQVGRSWDVTYSRDYSSSGCDTWQWSTMLLWLPQHAMPLVTSRNKSCGLCSHFSSSWLYW